jgi:flagellar hook-associated protein 2
LGLRFDPVGGGQFKDAVKQIIAAESQPIKALEQRKSLEESKLKLFGEFKNKFTGIDKAISEIADFRKFEEFKVDLGDGTSLASITLDKERAQAGSYQIQVDSLAKHSAIISNGFENPDDPVLGQGYINMYMPDGSKNELFVPPGKGSLNAVANLINMDNKSPVQAAVVQDAGEDEDSQWKLIVTSKKDGKLSEITFPDFYFLDGSHDFFIEDSHEAKNANVSIGGFPIELKSNDITDFLPGVNLHLKQARPDVPFTLTLSPDTQKISGKVKGLVDQVNEIFKFISGQNNIDEKSDTRTTFAGDTGLQTIEYRLRNMMHEGFPVGTPGEENFHVIFLNQIGVEFEKTGQLSFKEDKFNKALEKDYDGVAEGISGPRGFATQLRQVVSGYTTGQTGMLAIREKGMHDRIKEIDRQIDDKQRMMERRTQSLTEQFSRLEASLGNLQRQQQYLSATLPNSGGGGNLVQQLLGG